MLIFHITPCTPIGQYNHTNYCIEIKTQTSFFNPNSSITSLLSNITLCRSQNLYLRTSLGLFQVSSVDFDARLLTISHPCSSSDQSPILITKKKLAAKVSVRACIVCWIVKNVMWSTVLVAQRKTIWICLQPCSSMRRRCLTRRVSWIEWLRVWIFSHYYHQWIIIGMIMLTAQTSIYGRIN